MTGKLLVAAVFTSMMAFTAHAQTKPIDSPEAAIEAAKRWTKARCNTETPCTLKPEREGSQWRVWVQLTRRNAPNAAPQPYPGGTLIFYFDLKGNLLRRLEGD